LIETLKKKERKIATPDAREGRFNEKRQDFRKKEKGHVCESFDCSRSQKRAGITLFLLCRKGKEFSRKEKRKGRLITQRYLLRVESADSGLDGTIHEENQEERHLCSRDVNFCSCSFQTEKRRKERRRERRHSLHHREAKGKKSVCAQILQTAIPFDKREKKSCR